MLGMDRPMLRMDRLEGSRRASHLRHRRAWWRACMRYACVCACISVCVRVWHLLDIYCIPWHVSVGGGACGDSSQHGPCGLSDMTLSPGVAGDA